MVNAAAEMLELQCQPHWNNGTKEEKDLAKNVEKNEQKNLCFCLWGFFVFLVFLHSMRHIWLLPSVYSMKMPKDDTWSKSIFHFLHIHFPMNVDKKRTTMLTFDHPETEKFLVRWMNRIPSTETNNGSIFLLISKKQYPMLSEQKKFLQFPTDCSVHSSTGQLLQSQSIGRRPRLCVLCVSSRCCCLVVAASNPSWSPPHSPPLSAVQSAFGEWTIKAHAFPLPLLTQ